MFLIHILAHLSLLRYCCIYPKCQNPDNTRSVGDCALYLGREWFLLGRGFWGFATHTWAGVLKRNWRQMTPPPCYPRPGGDVPRDSAPGPGE